ncbi:MAG: Uma2 family endonuclease [Longimicrobiales bacterium]
MDWTPPVADRLLMESIRFNEASAKRAPITLAEYDGLRESDVWLEELVRGHVVREPPPTPYHGTIQANLARLLGQHVRADLKESRLKFAPDLAVEIVSPSNSAADLQEKVTEYLGAGSLQVWVVYPNTQQIMVYRNSAEVQLLKNTETLEGGGVIPASASR